MPAIGVCEADPGETFVQITASQVFLDHFVDNRLKEPVLLLAMLIMSSGEPPCCRRKGSLLRRTAALWGRSHRHPADPEVFRYWTLPTRGARRGTWARYARRNTLHVAMRSQLPRMPQPSPAPREYRRPARE